MINDLLISLAQSVCKNIRSRFGLFCTNLAALGPYYQDLSLLLFHTGLALG